MPTRKKAKKYDPKQRELLPTHGEVVQMRDWVMAGCPAASRAHDAPRCVDILWRLLEVLPKYHPVYAWGTPEWKTGEGTSKTQ